MMVEVLPYDPRWGSWFLELRDCIWPAISDVAVDIVHVGSTSIVGMSSKPIIDIDIIVDDEDRLDIIKERLATIGYRHVGDMGIEGREVFQTDDETLRPHHLYMCAEESVPFRNHMLLKKHLEGNPDSFRRYNELKLRLAETSSSRDEYTVSKTPLIIEFLRAEGVPESVLEDIRIRNLEP